MELCGQKIQPSVAVPGRKSKICCSAMQPGWILDHNTNEPIAYVFGTREHAYLDNLRDILGLYFEIKTIYTDGNPAYLNITESTIIQGKRNTQKIEGRHTALRTWCSRLVRKGIRFSKTFQMHKIAVGLVINYWYFGRVVW